MKNLLYTVLISLSLWGCSGFLDEVSQDRIIPETTDHYAALLLEEFSHSAAPVYQTVHLMTDNMQERSERDATHTQKSGYKRFYTWQRELEIDEEGVDKGGNDAWEDMYEDIAIANYVIELIDDAVGSAEEIAYVKGEAYFIRAYSYFNLLNLYGVPFNEASATNDLGVPLRLDIGVERTYRRNSVAECYTQIELDLKEATNLIEGSGITKSKWHPNVATCNLLMSRVKLYQKDWEATIAYANKVLDKYGLSVMRSEETFVTPDNDEILYSFLTSDPGGEWKESSYWQVSTSLYNSYDNADRRKENYFMQLTSDAVNANYMWTSKYTSAYSSIGSANFKVSEALLNRAEAYAASSQETLAIEDIKTLHAHRYSNTSGISYPANSNEVLSYVLEERNKELCFEEHHRWFDLRRMDNRPEIKHVYSVWEDGGTLSKVETFTLFSDDPNYTLPLPLTEMENNTLIKDIERYEKFPETEDFIVIP